MTKRVATLSASLLGFTVLCQADARVERRTTVKFGGAVGGVLNRLGGKAAREGVVETTTVKGTRRASLSANAGEIVDLGEEKIYQLDLDDKTFESLDEHGDVPPSAEIRADTTTLPRS